LLLEEHSARRTEPRLLQQSESRSTAPAGPLHLRSRETQAGIYRNTEDAAGGFAVHLALPAVERRRDAQQYRRLRSVPRRISAFSATNDHRSEERRVGKEC